MTNNEKATFDAGHQIDVTLDQILWNTRQEVAEGLLLCAVPRWFDQAMIAALRDNATDNDKILTRLQRFTFVSPLGGGRFTLHENVRDHLLARLEPQQLKTWHERAYAEYGRRLDNLSFLQQRSLELERVYHQLAFAPDAAISIIQELFHDAENDYSLELCESLVALLNQQPDVNLQNWAIYYQSRVELLYRRTETAAQLLVPLLAKLDQLDGDLRARVQFTFAVTESNKGHWQSAIDYYKRSFEYFQQAGRDNVASTIALEIAETYTNFTTLTQNTTYRTFAQKSPRISNFIHKLSLLPIALYLTWLLTGNPFGIGPGYFTRYHFEPVYHAIKWYRTALNLAKDVQVTFSIKLSLISLLVFTLNYKGSLIITQNLINSPAVKISRYQLALLNRVLANTYLMNGSLSEAEKLLDVSLEIFRNYGDRLYIAGTLSSRGIVHLLLGKRYQAIADYQESIAIFRDFNRKIELGRIFQQINDLDEALLEELEINENDRIFISQGQHRNQRLITIIWAAFFFIPVYIMSTIFASRLPLLIGLILIVIIAQWLANILIIPVAHILLPLSKLRELQSTFIVLDEEKISQLRMDETVQEEIQFEEIQTITFNQAAYWQKPLPRGAWLRIAARPDKEKEITVYQGWNLEFHKLVSRLKAHLVDYDVTWIHQYRSYLRSARYYILAVLYFGILVFGPVVLTETLFSPQGSSPVDVTILVTLLSLLFFFQFAPGLQKASRSRRRNRILLSVIGLGILLFGSYLAWQNEPAIIVIGAVLGFGLVVQVVLWIIQAIEWLGRKFRDIVKCCG